MRRLFQAIRPNYASPSFALAALAASIATSIAACGGESMTQPHCPPSDGRPKITPDSTGPLSAQTSAKPPPSVEEARAFVASVNADFKRIAAESARADWINQTYINDDTEKLSASAQEVKMDYVSRAIKSSLRFEGLKLPEEVSRQLWLLKLGGPDAGPPAPSDPKERSALAETVVWMNSAYGKGKYCPKRLENDPKAKSKCLSLNDLSNIMSKSRKYDELLDAWTGWHAVAPPLKEKYQRYVELANKGAKEIGFHDLGALWKSGYDMTPEQFEADTERLFQQVKPLYEQLHCYVRAQLRKTYGSDKTSGKAPIPAHLLGNMWAQEWTNIYDLVEPYKGEGSLDVTKKLQEKKLDEKAMVKLGENFFTSLGFAPLPSTFWERSLFKKPQDRDVVCHASAWDVSYEGDIRVKMCIQPKEEDLITIHHELGHDFYYQSYGRLPILFQSGANDGFHEGIGDTLALSVTPAYLKNIGLLDKVPVNQKGEINYLLKMALEKVAFLPFGRLIDQWRWDVFSGKIQPSDYNKAWWALRLKYQGVSPPVPRSESDFDPGAKYHVPAGTPYMRYFLARIYQFQFHRALCKEAGHKGPLHTCSIYGSKAAGDKLKAMLALGASKPWPEAMRALSGETQGDASAIFEYFEPLRKWLAEQTKGETCGW